MDPHTPRPITFAEAVRVAHTPVGLAQSCDNAHPDSGNSLTSSDKRAQVNRPLAQLPRVSLQEPPSGRHGRPPPHLFRWFTRIRAVQRRPRFPTLVCAHGALKRRGG